MNKRLFATVFLLFLLLVLWVFNDMGIISLSLHPFQNSAQAVGKVSKKIKEVQRRGKDSLSWEDIAQEDKLFNYDSVITMGHSGASLKMNDGLELTMDENTLITILPVMNQQDALTLNLKSGSYSLALHKGKQVRVNGVVLAAAEDSALKFKATQDTKIDVSIVTGEVSAPVGNVKTGESLTIDESQKTVKLDTKEPKQESQVVLAPPPPLPSPHQKSKSSSPKPIIQKESKKAIVAPSQGEAMEKRPDQEVMSQDLSELPEGK